jgi:hypothetical protein
MWFVDFVMAQRQLGISSLISMERDGFPYHRAEFNVPYSNIKVVPGECTHTLPTLGLSASKSLAWLDYTDTISNSILNDVTCLATNCVENSIILVTINAEKRSLPDKDQNGVAMEPEAALRSIAGDLVPLPLAPNRLTMRGYPYLLSSIIINQFERTVVNSGRSGKFVKLFEIAYSDDATMVTVGGIIADNDMFAFLQTELTAGWKGIIQDPIRVPALTLKEKIAIDRLLPRDTAITQGELDAVGVKLSAEKIDIYRRYYQHYPLFGEFHAL